MKLLAATSLIVAALVATPAEAGTIAAQGASAAISVHWNDRDDRHRGRHHRDQRRGYKHHRSYQRRGGHYRGNPALVARYGRRHGARAVNGYAELSQRRPCEWVTIERLDRYGDPVTVEFKRCFTANGYGFEVPGSRVLIR